MSKLYITANTDAIKTLRTARGHRWAKATVQSWERSYQLMLEANGTLTIAMGRGSTTDCPHTLCTIYPADADRILRLEAII